MAETEFKYWLRERRQSMGLSQDELGQQVGITGTALGRWESGQNLPDPRSLRKLAEVIGADEEDLFRMVGYLSPTAEKRPPGAFSRPLEREIARLLDDLSEEGLLLLRDQIVHVLKSRYRKEQADGEKGTKEHRAGG